MGHLKAALPLRLAAVFAMAFGLLTVVSGGAALFGGGPAREAVGAAVGFVLWFNFLAGFLYVVGGLGLWLRQRWAAVLAAALAGATALVFLAFGVHVAQGGAFEARTVGAMSLRTVAWGVIAWLAWRHLWRERQLAGN